MAFQWSGAQGAYQAGLYEALSEASIYPIAGMAIAAIIAGNAPNDHVDWRREFGCK